MGRKRDEELFLLFIDLFTCPLCRNTPLTVHEAYFDDAPSGYDGI
jgi:hypothetical protein